MTVTCVDDPPAGGRRHRDRGRGRAATAIDVLANDTDPDGAADDHGHDAARQRHGGDHGRRHRAELQPNANYCNDPPGTAPDTFTYTVNGTATATVSVTVTCVDDPPVAVDDAATVARTPARTRSTCWPTTPTSTAGHDDHGHDGRAERHGRDHRRRHRSTYQPDADYCNDPPGVAGHVHVHVERRLEATVTVTVTCVDDPPVAVDDSATVAEDAAATAIDVLANDTDADGGPPTITATTNGSNGTVVITGGGTGLTYQPAANYCNDPPGTSLDTFTYTLNGGSTGDGDGHGHLRERRAELHRGPEPGERGEPERRRRRRGRTRSTRGRPGSRPGRRTRAARRSTS